jgi:hypothetical protein
MLGKTSLRTMGGQCGVASLGVHEHFLPVKISPPRQRLLLPCVFELTIYYYLSLIFPSTSPLAARLGKKHRFTIPKFVILTLHQLNR